MIETCNSRSRILWICIIEITIRRNDLLYESMVILNPNLIPVLLNLLRFESCFLSCVKLLFLKRFYLFLCYFLSVLLKCKNNLRLFSIFMATNYLTKNCDIRTKKILRIFTFFVKLSEYTWHVVIYFLFNDKFRW